MTAAVLDFEILSEDIFDDVWEIFQIPPEFIPSKRHQSKNVCSYLNFRQRMITSVTIDQILMRPVLKRGFDAIDIFNADFLQMKERFFAFVYQVTKETFKDTFTMDAFCVVIRTMAIFGELTLYLCSKRIFTLVQKCSLLWLEFFETKFKVILEKSNRLNQTDELTTKFYNLDHLLRVFVLDHCIPYQGQNVSSHFNVWFEINFGKCRKSFKLHSKEFLDQGRTDENDETVEVSLQNPGLGIVPHENLLPRELFQKFTSHETEPEKQQSKGNKNRFKAASTYARSLAQLQKVQICPLEVQSQNKTNSVYLQSELKVCTGDQKLNAKQDVVVGSKNKVKKEKNKKSGKNVVFLSSESSLNEDQTRKNSSGVEN